MKKKYFAPEMEEMKLDEPMVLDEVVEGSLEEIVECGEEEEA